MVDDSGRKPVQPSGEIQELLNRPVLTWDDDTWSNAANILLTQFPEAMNRWLQNDDITLLDEPLRLLHRLCQERPNVEGTSELVTSCLTMVGNQIDRRLSSQRDQRHKEFFHTRQLGPNRAITLSTAVYASMEHVIKNSYWRPGTTMDFQVMTRLAALTDTEPAARAQRWLSKHHMASRYMGRHLAAPNRYDFTIVMRAWAASSDPAAAESASLLIRQWQKSFSSSKRDPLLKPTEAGYVSWIVCLTNAGANSRKEAIAAARKAENLLPGFWKHAEAIDFWPGTAIYNAIIQGWAKARRPEKAEAVLRELCKKANRHRYCMPDATSFTTVIAAWAKAENDRDAPEQAEKILRMMQEFANSTRLEAVEPNAVTVTAVLQCWAKSNRPNAPVRAEAILRRMQELVKAGNLKMQPNAITYNLCMNAWSRSGHADAPEKVEVLYRELCAQYQLTKSARLKPDHVTYIARINAWERCQYQSPQVAAVNATAVLEEMMAIDDPSVYPNELHFNRIIAAWTKCGDAASAEFWLERMIDDYLVRGIMHSAPSRFSFHFAMSAWSQKSTPESATRVEALLNRMTELSTTNAGLSIVTPNVVSYNTCLATWARSGAENALDRARLLLQQMNDNDLKPDSYSYGALLRMVAKSTQTPETKTANAEAFVLEMKENGVEFVEELVRLAAQCGVKIS